MDGRRFDEIARSLATSTDRRSVLKKLGAGAAGGALALLGARRDTEATSPRPAGATCVNNPQCASGLCDPRTRRCVCPPGQVNCNGACLVPATCQPGQCGILPNGCGGNLDCGGCTLPQTCGGGGQAGVCGCTPQPDANFCTPGICNRPTNNCGQTVVCGCTDRQTCSDGTCCGAIYQSCDPANDDCCNASVCKAVDGANVCCGVSGVSPCNASTAARCCSGACNLGTCA